LTGDKEAVTVSYGVVTSPKISLASLTADVLMIGRDEKGFVSQFAYEISKHRCFERELDGLNVQVAF
jgi:catalase